ncbi:NUDIX hydrolase [Flavobacterium foetidum]|uniref:NUDIX hydrolase n=1 Tax=Flavobacterium foetidum TaxID=2026681 RepID=UPI001074FABF|nr:CoA pyrophosphatase [Flavobacterium foetidum]KAF2517649.1 CoA pyrophosphatase [Flavobacterium foetidum]
MNFQAFLKYVPNIIETALPAVESHLKMAPKERIESLRNLVVEDLNARKAAVMMLFYPKNGETNLVLIVRNTYKGIHSAQIAFPGGKYEEDDFNFEATALRETHEEIGVAPELIQIVKPFTPMYIPPSNFLVHPFLGIAENELTFFPDLREVANIIELPLNVFLDDEIMIETELSTSYASGVLVPAFSIQNHIVWGATAMILSELRDVLQLAFAENKQNLKN